MDIKVLGSGSKGNCYIVSDGVTSLMLDCGLPLKQILIACKFKMSEISACLVTHNHMDHIKAAKGLASYAVPVYASQGCLNASGLQGSYFKVVKSQEQFTVGTFRIMPFDVEHDVPEPLGFLLYSTVTKEKLLYFTDTYYLKYKFSGLTHIMGECNYSKVDLQRSVDEGRVNKALAERLLFSHMSLEHFKEFLQANDLSKVKQIYLLHLSDNNSNAERFKEEIQRMAGVEVYVC